MRIQAGFNREFLDSELAIQEAINRLFLELQEKAESIGYRLVGPTSVRMGDEHSDLFIRNQVPLIAECDAVPKFDRLDIELVVD